MSFWVERNIGVRFFSTLGSAQNDNLSIYARDTINKGECKAHTTQAQQRMKNFLYFCLIFNIGLMSIQTLVFWHKSIFYKYGNHIKIVRSHNISNF